MRPKSDRASTRHAEPGCRWFRPAGRSRRSEWACPGSESLGPLRSRFADTRMPRTRTSLGATKSSLMSPSTYDDDYDVPSKHRALGFTMVCPGVVFSIARLEVAVKALEFALRKGLQLITRYKTQTQ